MTEQPIADAERDRVIGALQRSHAAGQLDQAILRKRVDVALATGDRDQLDALLSDLPNYAGRTWVPSAQQQLAPYQPVTPAEPPAKPPARSPWIRYVLPLVFAGFTIMALLTLVTGNSFVPALFWWVFFFMALNPALRRWQRSRSGSRQRHSQPPPPPRIRDSYSSEDSQGGWQQPPNSPHS